MRAALVLFLALTGCGITSPALRMGPVDEMLARQPDHCGLAALPDLTGKPMERLADFRLVGPLRVLWPGQEITNEVQPQRLNVQVDVSGRVLRMMCG